MRMKTGTARRAWLRRLAAAGLVPLLTPLLLAMSRLPAGRTIYRLQGTVRVNGRPVDETTLITLGDVVETGADGMVIFAVGSDVFMVKANSRYEVQGSNGVVQLCRLVTGAVLQVFGQGARRLESGDAVIGVRGTAVYMEARRDESYVCTCYGEAELSSRSDPQLRETVRTTHHETPRWFRRGSDGRPRIEPAPVINHTDDELILLESLVNRTPPFLLLDLGGSRY
ncbi:hypothetical protein [Sulfurivermis fontis]|uniref:hypothetical protein n=1 Tax=Sulfurivermis fontis TaxID=1972068 RepID=UPI0011AE3326|nr:hypothetical protein [Sulfurivermis fontis]